MSHAYIRRLANSTAAAAMLSLRQALRQQWFLIVLVPFAIVVLAAPLLPATSETAAFRLLLRVVLGGGFVILSIGIMLAGSAGLPAEVRDKTLHRSFLSPGGRLTALTGRIAAFAILTALISGAGFAATLGVHFARTAGSPEFTAASEQYSTITSRHHAVHAGVPPERIFEGVLWIDEKLPGMCWEFPSNTLPSGGGIRLQVMPVVASAVETDVKISARKDGTPFSHTQTIRLLDNRPTYVEFPALPESAGVLRVTIERLPGSSPFGFDVRKNELGGERNGVSVLVGERSFAANLLAAWFVVWAKLCFAATLAVFASTFLSGPIAGSFSLLLFLLANMLGFLREFADSLGRLTGHVHAHMQQALPEPTFFQKALQSLVLWFADLYPDLSRYDSTDALIWGRAMPFDFLLMALLYFLGYSALLWCFSALILRRREL